MDMRILFCLFVACAALVGGVVAKPGDNHAKEHQNTPLWINIPVPPSDLDSVLANTGLTADVYSDGNAYVQILTYNLDSLQTWLFNKWVDVTITPGWVSKLNILVVGPRGRGYMIKEIDFQLDSFVDWFTGLIRNIGALTDQKIPSHPCGFKPGFPTATKTLTMSFECQYLNFHNNIWNWIVNDGYNGHATYTEGVGNGVSTDDFVRWAVVRNNKYEKQFDGTVVWADVTFPNITDGLDKWYPIQASDNAWSTNLLKTRMGLSKNYPICSLTDKNYCFWASYYGLIDHENTIIKAKTNDIAVDGALVNPDTTTPTASSSQSNNMIWLYGILVGAGASIGGALAMYAVMSYRARGQQVLKATVQHAASVELP